MRDFDTREESVSVDIVHYANWLDDLKNSTNIDQFLVKAFNEINGGDRPLSLVLLYPFVLVSPDSFPELIVILVPLILSPVLVLVTFFITKRACFE